MFDAEVRMQTKAAFRRSKQRALEQKPPSDRWLRHIDEACRTNDHSPATVGPEPRRCEDGVRRLSLGDHRFWG